MAEEERFPTIERSRRLGQFCNMNMVEDEHHFLLVCPAFRDFGKAILPGYYCIWPTTMFAQLVSSPTAINTTKASYIYISSM